jgi:hypothetical protein
LLKHQSAPLGAKQYSAPKRSLGIEKVAGFYKHLTPNGVKSAL